MLCSIFNLAARIKMQEHACSDSEIFLSNCGEVMSCDTGGYSNKILSSQSKSSLDHFIAQFLGIFPQYHDFLKHM